MENKNIKYFLYARRSIEKSDREEKVASIESQIKEMREIADRDNLRIVGTFRETKSAKEPYARAEFTKMMEQIKKGKADGILCWKMDRLARNSIDEGTVKYFLQKGIVKNIKASDRDWYPDDNALMASVEFGMATQYSRDLSKHIMRGMRAKAEAGHRLGVAPLGYKNSKYHIKGTEKILVDEERFDSVRKIFDLMLTGKYSPVDLQKIAVDDLHINMRYGRRKDSKMSKRFVYKLLSSTFYYGQFEFPEGSGNWYDGKHKPMISKEEYDKIQILLGREGRPRPKTHRFAYTGLLKCTECGASITAEEKHKIQQNGNVHHYTYYRCTKRLDSKCTQKALSEKEMDGQILEYLKKIKIPKSINEWVISAFREIYEEEKKSKGSLAHIKKEKLENVKNRISNLLDMRVNNEITPEEFSKLKSDLEREKHNLEGDLTDNNDLVESWFVKLQNAFDFSQTACEEFGKAIIDLDLDKKRGILASLGYNHQLKDRILTILPFKPFLAVEKLSNAIDDLPDKLEPPKNLTAEGYNGRNALNSALMWRWAESNRRA